MDPGFHLANQIGVQLVSDEDDSQMEPGGRSIYELEASEQ
jgi:hypothetical protein